MTFLTNVPSQLDNILTVALVAALALVVIVAVICKAASKKKDAATAAVQVEVVPQEPPATAPGSAGRLKLHNVAPKTAAMLMAIIAEKTGKPLNELRFVSIKEVE